MKREGQVDNGVDLAWHALINVERQFEVPFQRGGRIPDAVELDETTAQFVVGDGEVALVVGASGFGAGALGEGVHEAAVALHGLFGEPEGDQGCTFVIDEEVVVVMLRG